MKTITLVASLLFAFSSFAQESAAIGSVFPEMETESLDSTVMLPDALLGKYSIIGLAYNKKSEGRMPEWILPIYQKFIMEPQGLSFAYDVNTYFVMMFSGVNVALEGVAKSKVASEVDPELLPHILFQKGELKKYQTFLDMLGRKDTPYFFVLDPQGKILWATRGSCRDAKINKLASYVKAIK